MVDNQPKVSGGPHETSQDAHEADLWELVGEPYGFYYGFEET